MKRELDNESLQQTRHHLALARSSLTSYATMHKFSTARSSSNAHAIKPYFSPARSSGNAQAVKNYFSPARSSGNAQAVKHYFYPARSSDNAPVVKDYFSPAKSSTSSHAVAASIRASSSSPSQTAHPNSPLAKYFANTIFRVEQQDTDVVDNIHICIASDLIESSKDISESKMGPKDVNFSLYRSILRDAGILNDQICLICYVDSKGQRRGIYNQSMFVAAVEYQTNQAEANHMIIFHGCASLSPKTAKKVLPSRAAVVSSHMD